MQLRPSTAETEFREELRGWLERELKDLPAPPDPDDWPARRAFDTGWQRRLHDAGYAGISWPVEVGGRGASPTDELAYLEESERLGAPLPGCNFVGTLHAGPTLAAVGTDEQRRRHLPGILRGDHVWCQGFSEPEAGSDLASLRTRAVRDGDHYVVTGQKIWTSHAHVADFCELLVRTGSDAERHRGLTWLIMPMDAPGITLSPLRTLTGVSEFNQMFLDEVRVPVANRVGDEGGGWSTAMVTFSFERGTAFVGEQLRAMRLVADLAGRAAAGRHDLRRSIAAVAAELDGLWALTQRNVSEAARGANPSLGGSMFKLGYAGTRARLGDLAMRLLGRDGLALFPPGEPGLDHVEERLYALSLSIAAGTAQVQRDIIAERHLGLPRDR